MRNSIILDKYFKKLETCYTFRVEAVHIPVQPHIYRCDFQV